MDQPHDLIVEAEGEATTARRGTAHIGGLSWRCALGRGGLSAAKREGDGATPIGRFPLRRLLYRPDRLPRPTCVLPVAALAPSDGWCDDPADPAYNRAVTLPYPASCETLWRDDRVYDLVLVAGHNDAPAIAGAGSAIFIHCATDDFSPTAGCVAFAHDDLLAVLARLTPDSMLDIRSR